MTNYQPLATSPTVADVVESQQHKLSVRRRWHLRARPLLLLCLLGTCSVFGILYALFLRPSSYETIALKAADNPYFQTGDVWTHNDQVAARLERCASLGLLRNTSLPLAPHERLSDEEESELVAQGCGTNETTVIILSSLFFAEAFSGASVTGETVYAQSIISTLNAYNYSYVFSSLGWWNPDMRKTVELWHKHRWNVRMVLADPEQIDTCWKLTDQKCLKTEENVEGIEAWRLLAFWYWDDPGTPLGPQFTLSPSPRNANHFLSYSIEPTCHRLPYLAPSHRSDPPQAYLLAKQMHYLDDTPAFSWTLPALMELQDEFGIQVVAGLKDDDPVTAKAVEDIGLKNLGRLGVMEFYEQLSKSFVLLGVGRPRISPSPWDALCMGVPFINPILTWDETDPPNRTKWHAQQWHMTDLNPPYVYSVPAHNLTALRLAVHAALTNPIESFIPSYMKWEFVLGKMVEMVEGDWREKAKRLLEERIRDGGRVSLF
ncbi:hypothetical protein I305_03547 [Cryptococcus gattii E566]|uniref:Glycosyltransferase family 18 catalytic domain-containing protein n=2 Tax=Cryptococcus gattii TaxID=37769 RepID=E6R583_CRYGW|nr:uncharacterized protein CGB_D0150C [Cryptococcus gattii WM276]ADV21512.1 hypothetical protein CNL06660 [Cryptococcus gattii WM276]KIR81060.1 hypothetical protein I306_01773 [Cryptococcus gattii EJB2]KIY34192.1 hypothetical protein I305_03547 [Cryptococcus gattii E566]KJE03679.1 hypothetical protein I311_02442 [Cryptococcus gattii NT-10]